MSEYTADVDGIGALRLLNAVRACGLEKHTRLYQVSPPGVIVGWVGGLVGGGCRPVGSTVHTHHTRTNNLCPHTTTTYTHPHPPMLTKPQTTAHPHYAGVDLGAVREGAGGAPVRDHALLPPQPLRYARVFVWLFMCVYGLIGAPLDPAGACMYGTG